MLLLSAVGKRRKVEIVNNCFIGTNSIILKGTIVGDNVIIGAGSVLAGGAFPPDSVAAKIRQRLFACFNLLPFDKAV